MIRREISISKPIVQRRIYTGRNSNGTAWGRNVAIEARDDIISLSGMSSWSHFLSEYMKCAHYRNKRNEIARCQLFMTFCRYQH